MEPIANLGNIFFIDPKVTSMEKNKLQQIHFTLSSEDICQLMLL